MADVTDPTSGGTGHGRERVEYADVSTDVPFGSGAASS